MFLNEIRQWFRDLRLCSSSEFGRASMLIYCYNWATCPRTLRTDGEHRICRALTRWIRRQLASMPGWWLECDNGQMRLARVR